MARRGEPGDPGGGVRARCLCDRGGRHPEISSSLIYTWRRLAKAATTSGSGFVEAIVTDGGVKAQPTHRAVIRVELAAARVNIGTAASPALVGAVLRALR